MGDISDIGCDVREPSASEIMMKLNVRSSSHVTDMVLHDGGLCSTRVSTAAVFSMKGGPCHIGCIPQCPPFLKINLFLLHRSDSGKS